MTVTRDDATALSTQPVPVAPPPPPGGRRQPLAPLRRTWRQLTSMRTALLLLFLLALASVPGSFLPQRNINPVLVNDYLVANPTLGPLLDRLGMFDAFAAPWFAAIYLLLFVSLVGCLGPRIRLHAKALRTPPPPVPRVLTRMPETERWETTADAAAVLRDARAALKGWRVVERPVGDGPGGSSGALSAEKGYLRETGNLLFHLSLVALLIGIALGALLGFKGTVLVQEGKGFANAIASYDDITPGRRFDQARLVPFSFQLEDFRATYADDGTALTFNADLSYKDDVDARPQPYDLRVNHPLAVGGAKTYLLGHGYAPKVRVTDREGNALEQTVTCLPQGPTFISTCAIKYYDAAGEAIAFDGIFTPTTLQDPETNRVTSIHPAADAPALTVLGFRGPRREDGRAESVYAVDKTGLEPIDGGAAHKLEPGDTWTMPGGGSITYLETTEWATFQITQDPGKVVALIAGTTMILGLCLSLFVRRRRLWVRITPAPAGGGDGSGRTVVEVAGLARTGADAFSSEFATVTGRLRETAQTAPVEGRT